MKKEKSKISKRAKNTIFALSAGTALLFTGGLLTACDGGGATVTNVAFYSGIEDPTVETGKVGDFYFETDTCNLWLKNADGWAVVSTLKGPQGEQGAAGRDGTDGRAGVDGRNGKSAFQIAKDAGLTNAQTPEDWILELQGQTKGKDGTQIYSGTVAPTQETEGAVGDYYLNETTGELYKLTETGWVLKSTLKGADGAEGQQGEAGAPGAAGTQITMGTVAPTVAANAGDLYINTADNFKLYRYDGTEWTVVGELKGADGAQGAPGQNGQPGADGVSIEDFNLETYSIGILYTVSYTQDQQADRFIMAENGNTYKLKRGSDITTDTTTLPEMEIVTFTTIDDQVISLVAVEDYGVVQYHEVTTGAELRSAIEAGACIANITQNIETDDVINVADNLMINLNGKSITNAASKILNITAGNVMINDTVGTGAISATGSLKDAITIADGANSSFMVNGATISGTNRAINCGDDNSEMMLNGANLSGGSAAAVQTYGLLEINGGTLTGTGQSTNGVQLSGYYGSVKVTGATISGTKYGIMGSSVESIEIVSGTISGTLGGVSTGVGSCIIRDATISSSTKYAIAVTSGTVTIENGTFTGATNALEINGSNYKNSAIVTIEDGTFVGTENAISFTAAAETFELNINGGSFTGTENGIYNIGGKINIEGATITGTNGYGIQNFNRKRATALPFVVGTVEISNSTITGGTDMVYNPTAEYYLSSTKKDDGDTVGNTGGIVNFEIANLAGLTSFRDSVNAGNTYEGVTVKLMSNINLGGIEWTPIGYGTCNNGDVTQDLTGPQFKGTFDGQDYTISNFVISTFNQGGEQAGASAGVGFFGQVVCATIQNVNIESAQVTGNHWVGALAGFVTHSTIDNCSVTNVQVSCVFNNEDDSGDKAGALVGYISGDYTNIYPASAVTNCSAINSAVDADRDAGQVIGCTWETVDTTGTTANNVTVTGNGSSASAKSGQNINEAVVGRIAA